MTEPISESEREHILKALSRAPRAFRQRLVRVLEQAMEDEDDGDLEVTANISGPQGSRYMREWVAFFRAVGRRRRESS